MEEEKSVRYDAKKLVSEVFRKWQALIVITLVVAVIFCVIAITGSSKAQYEAKEGFTITYPEIDIPEGVNADMAALYMSAQLTKQQNAVTRAVDTLANRAYIELYNALMGTLADGEYTMDVLKEGISITLSNSNTTITVSVTASSAKDAVFMLDNLKTQVEAAIGSGETAGFKAEMTYQYNLDELEEMYSHTEGGAGEIILIVIEGIVIGFVAAVVILLIWSAVFMRVTYAEDITMQTDYAVLSTVYEGENSAGEAFIKSAIVRKKGDKVTYVLGVSRGAGEVASAWAAREKLSCNALYVDFDREGEGGLASVSDGADIKSAISEGTLTAGSGLDLYGKREQVSEIIAVLAEKYDRIIISGYTAADARSELVGALADDTVLVVDEGFAVKKLIRLEEKYKAEGRSVEGVILRKKNSRRQGR